MNFDDTHPDYFVDDDSHTGSASGSPAGNHAPEAKAGIEGRTISFSTGDVADSGASPAHSGDEPEKKNCCRWRRILIWAAVVALVVLAVAVWFRYYNPCIVDARMKCYVISVEKRGVVFKTFEADVVSEQSLTDTSRVYSREVSFSVPDAAQARELQAVQGTGRPVVIDYKVYSASLPWRGASKQVVTGVKTE